MYIILFALACFVLLVESRFQITDLLLGRSFKVVCTFGSAWAGPASNSTAIMSPLHHHNFVTPVTLLPYAESEDRQNKRPSQPHFDTPDPKRQFATPLPGKTKPKPFKLSPKSFLACCNV